MRIKGCIVWKKGQPYESWKAEGHHGNGVISMQLAGQVVVCASHAEFNIEVD